jgi:hypothetical protein
MHAQRIRPNNPDTSRIVERVITELRGMKQVVLIVPPGPVVIPSQRRQEVAEGAKKPKEGPASKVERPFADLQSCAFIFYGKAVRTCEPWSSNEKHCEQCDQGKNRLSKRPHAPHIYKKMFHLPFSAELFHNVVDGLYVFWAGANDPGNLGSETKARRLVILVPKLAKTRGQIRR